MTDVWTIVSAIGTAVGAIGGVTGIIALLQTRHGNKLAKSANGLAEEANGTARESNALAAEANKISADAKTIAERALNVSSDQTVYDWRSKNEDSAGGISIVNNSPNAAHDVRIIVLYRDEPVLDVCADAIAGFRKFTLQSDFIRKKQIEYAVRQMNTGTNWIPIVGDLVIIHITWTSDLGIRRNDSIKHSIR